MTEYASVLDRLTQGRKLPKNAVTAPLPQSDSKALLDLATSHAALAESLNRIVGLQRNINQSLMAQLDAAHRKIAALETRTAEMERHKRWRRLP